ncbi:MAG TPA: hypothetical protein G4O04_07190 [Anaerolineae bacterium]|nr:hypothetical protein [Anaerolineae bacterium]
MAQRLGTFFILLGILLALLFVHSVLFTQPIYDFFFLGVIFWVIGGTLLVRGKA